MTVPFIYNFEAYHSPVKLFFKEEGNLKFSDSKMRWKEESKNFSLS